MKKFLSKLDWILLICVFALVGFGILMIYSASVGDTDTTNYVLRQSLYFGIGLLALSLVVFVGFRTLLNLSYWLFGFLVVLLVVTFLLGLETRGSVRWIDFGFFTLQGSEIAKPVLVLFLSSFFVAHSPAKIRNVLVSLVLTLIPVALTFFQPDLGSAFVLLTIWVSLVYLAGLSGKQIIAMILVGAVCLPIGYTLLRDYQKARLTSFINPYQDPLGSGYNIVQSIIAVGSGQLTGRGFGRGTQSHLNFLPEQKTDFIFATTAEELGFLGIAGIFALFSLLLYRLVLIGNRCREKVGQLVCYGGATVVAIQFFVNAGMNMGLVPVTGITLPFISFGGSSLISMLVLIGLAESVELENKS